MIVNAVSAARPTKPGPFGGGTLSEATVEDFRGWTGAVAEQAFVFLSEGVRAGATTLIQVTGGSARAARWPGAACGRPARHATRALVHAAAQELREDGVHVALLIVDATIDSPKTASMIAGKAENETADQARDRARRRVPRGPDGPRVDARAGRHACGGPLAAVTIQRPSA